MPGRAWLGARFWRPAHSTRRSVRRRQARPKRTLAGLGRKTISLADQRASPKASRTGARASTPSTAALFRLLVLLWLSRPLFDKRGQPAQSEFKLFEVAYFIFSLSVPNGWTHHRLTPFRLIGPYSDSIGESFSAPPPVGSLRPTFITQPGRVWATGSRDSAGRRWRRG